MQNNHKNALGAGLAAILGFTGPVAQAVLPDGAVLEFVPGVVVYDSYGYTMNVVSGSYFAVDLNANNKFSGNEKTPIEMNDGIILGTSQPANAAAPGIDRPWMFFGIQGVHRTSSPVSDNGDGTLDFSGWGINWYDIDIPIGDTLRAPVPDTLRATIVCSSNPCQVGDSYMLDYVGHVPMGHVSGFGGVRFGLHLEGTIADGVLRPRVAISVEGGALQECTSHDGARVTASANIYMPPGDTLASVEWTLNGDPIGSGEQISQNLALGSSTLAAQLLTQSGATASATSSVTVRDTQAPAINAAFVDARTGEPVTQVNRNSRLRIQARAEDVCDPAPAVQAVIGAPVSDGGVVDIQVKRDHVSLSVPQMQLSVTARDASNNTASGAAGLSVGE